MWHKKDAYSTKIITEDVCQVFKKINMSPMAAVTTLNLLVITRVKTSKTTKESVKSAFKSFSRSTQINSKNIYGML